MSASSVCPSQFGSYVPFAKPENCYRRWPSAPGAFKCDRFPPSIEGMKWTKVFISDDVVGVLFGNRRDDSTRSLLGTQQAQNGISRWSRTPVEPCGTDETYGERPETASRRRRPQE